MCPDMLLGGPECGSQGFPAFTTAGLVVGVGVLGCEAGCAGGGFCAAAELVVDELGAVVFAGQAAFMGVVVGEGVSGLVDEQSQGVVLVVGAWHVEAEATVPAVHGVEEGVEVCGLPVFVDAQVGEGVAQSADVIGFSPARAGAGRGGLRVFAATGVSSLVLLAFARACACVGDHLGT